MRVLIQYDTMKDTLERASLILLCYYCVTAGCQLFNCLSSSDSSSDVVFYPNISDVHFESSNATLYPRSNGNHSRFYTVPFSPSGRNCSGIVTSIKHCYWIFNREFASNVTVFQVVLGNRTHRSFVVTRIITVVSQPQTDICTQVKNNRRVCCDTYELPNHQMFHITSSQFTYGINLLKHQVTFRKNIKYFEVSWFKRNNIVRQGQHVNFNFGMARRSGPMLLLRFSIVPNEASSTVTSSTTRSTTIASTSGSTASASTSGSTASASTSGSTASGSTSGSTASASTSEPSTGSLRAKQATGSLFTSTGGVVLALSSDDVEGLDSDNMGFIDDGGSNGALIGGVAGVLVGILVLMLVAVCVVLVWLRIRRKRKSVAITSRGPREFNNAIYGEVELQSQDLEYADVGPAVFSSTKQEVQLKDNEYSYAEWGASQGATYEEPIKLVKYDQDAKNYTPVEEDIYMVPPSSEDALYSQLDGMGQNLLRESLSLGDSLGSGQFGAVYEGVWRRGPEEVQVAVKTLKEGAKEEDRVKFLQEAAIMGQFKHPNVVTMYGVVKEGEPILLVIELLMKGDLRDYLLKARSGTGEGMNGHTLLSYCRQVVSGMVYLSSKAFVHRDLAARNILLCEDEICKIADFGMSRDLMYESFYVSHGGMIPVKWTAPEALYYKTYSTASDVWSFGALMYEIWSVGHKPFETLANNKVLSAISSGVRLAPPPGCPRKLYSIMIECWHPESSKRPSFMDLCKRLSLPDSKLLLWSEEDRSVHPEADRLEADLQCAQELYKDLQTKYLKK